MFCRKSAIDTGAWTTREYAVSETESQCDDAPTNLQRHGKRRRQDLVCSIQCRSVMLKMTVVARWLKSTDIHAIYRLFFIDQLSFRNPASPLQEGREVQSIGGMSTHQQFVFNIKFHPSSSISFPAPNFFASYHLHSSHGPRFWSSLSLHCHCRTL